MRKVREYNIGRDVRIPVRFVGLLGEEYETALSLLELVQFDPDSNLDYLNDIYDYIIIGCREGVIDIRALEGRARARGLAFDFRHRNEYIWVTVTQLGRGYFDPARIYLIAKLEKVNEKATKPTEV